MGNNLKHISLILLCMLAIPAAYGQTKKVVRQPQNSTTQKSSNAAKKKQTSNTARRSSAKTAPKPKQPAAASNTPKSKQPAAGNYVDLGLPSGTLWADRNVGANSPEEYGDYFAWGETASKDNYSWSTYKYSKDSKKTMTKYCVDNSYGYNGFTDSRTELLPEDDAATANWGAGWQMPMVEQLDELVDSSYTTTEWTTQNGVYGRKITSKINGNSLFLPTTGFRIDGSLYYAGSRGYYWSRSLNTDDSDVALDLHLDSGDIYASYGDYRFSGLSVRPVRTQK